MPSDPDAKRSAEIAPDAIRLSRIVTIVNLRGLHARAAARFVVTAERFATPVDVTKGSETVSARSIMGLMMLGAGRGTKIILEADADGWDARQALDALVTLVESGFDERE